MSFSLQTPNLSSSQVEVEDDEPQQHSAIPHLSSSDVELDHAHGAPSAQMSGQEVQWDNEAPQPPTAPAPTQPIKPAPVQVSHPDNRNWFERTFLPDPNIAPPPLKPGEQAGPGGDAGEAFDTLSGANAYKEFAARKGAEIAARNPSMRQMTPEEAQAYEADTSPAAHADVGGMIREKMVKAGSEFGANALESGIRQPITGPLAGQNLPMGEAERGIVRGTGAFTGSVLADPSTYMLMGMGPESRFGRALMGAGFGVQMGQGAIESSEELGKVWDREDIPREQKIEMGTQSVLGAVMASVSAKHSLQETHAIIQDYLNHIPESDRQAVQNKIDERIRSATPEPTQAGIQQLSSKDVEFQTSEPAAKAERFRLPRGTSAAEVQGPVKGPNIRTVQVGDKTYAFDQRKINADGVTSAVERNELWRLNGGKAPESAKLQAEQDVRGEEPPANNIPPEVNNKTTEDAPEQPVKAAAPEVQWDDEEKPAEQKPKHDFASTQINIEPASEIGKRHAAAVQAIPAEHIGPNGKEETPHVTVRYGLKDDSPEAVGRIKEAAAKIPPFDATIGKTGSFPATKEGDHPIIAHVEKSPELEHLRKTVEGAGDFKPDDHGEYKPHVTLGYVKAEHLAEHKGGNHLEGGKVPVDHVVISKKDGTQEVIKLGGQQSERRTNAAERKRVADMNPEEMARELHTSRLDNGDGTHTEMPIPNGRAFHDAPSSPTVAMSDADALKAFNDKFGYKAGNIILVAKAEAAKEAGLDAYHQKGDEFLYRGESPEHLKAGLEKARGILKNREFTVTDSTGKTVTLKGVDFSYGTGTDLKTAEAGLHAHKTAREAAGERARGQFGRIAEVGSEAADQGRTEAEGSAEVKPPEGIPAKGQAGRVPINRLTLAPREFQYKLNTNEHGVTNLLRGQKWNDDLAGVISVWHNPADGKTYVVNGHHRVQLARENGVRDMLVRHLNVDNAGEARAVGALQNIAEGRGTPIDAAKFLRDSGITPQDMEQRGISMGEATAESGLALARLDKYLFDKVVSGELQQSRGIAIGKATDNPATQEAIFKLIEKAERRGRKVTSGMVSDLAIEAKRAKETTTERSSLFGNSYRTENNALDKAEISDYIRGQIAKEKRVFGAVSSEEKAAVLGQVKDQNIKPGENQRISREAAQAEEVYDKLRASRGPIDEILESAAAQLARRENAGTVKADAYKQIRAELQKALAGEQGSGANGTETHAGRTEENESAVDRQASVRPSNLEALRKPKLEEQEPSLPGMRPHLNAEKEAVAEKEGEDLSREVAAPKANISAKTGEMERSSPLFRDSEASGQGGLFGEQRGGDINEMHARGELPPDITAKSDLSGKTVPAKAPAFFSKAEQVAEEKLPNSVKANQVISTLQNAGVKADELKWLGLDDYLKGKDKVSKADLLDHIRQNNVQVKEVVKGTKKGATPPLDWQHKPETDRDNEHWTTEDSGYQVVRLRTGMFVLDKLNVDGETEPGDEYEQVGMFGSREEAQNAAARDYHGDIDSDAKFSTYQLPGGENYRELLLTLPEDRQPLKPYDQWRKENMRGAADSQQLRDLYAEQRGKENKPSFKSSHFEEPNVLAHIRFNDRVDAEGKKTLFMEELQSDWHQKGRKQGYLKPYDAATETKAKSELDAAWAALRPMLAEADNLGYDSLGEVKKDIALGDLRPQDIDGSPELLEAAQKYHETHAAWRQAAPQSAVTGVPDAPFKSTWHELAMKRMLRYAAENGYDKLAWTTGEQQAAQYDLSKQISRIEYSNGRYGDNLLKAYDHGGTAVISKPVPPNELPDVIGKEAADKLLAKPEEKTKDGTVRSIAGLDLKVGGSGMKGFYDKILPDFLNKYGKKWGAKVGETQIPVGADEAKYREAERSGDSGKIGEALGGKTKVHSIPITPGMRKEVVFSGQPLYAGLDPIAASRAIVQTVKDANGVIQKGKGLYHGAIDKALDWAHMGQTRPEIRKFDSDAADLATKMDAGGQYSKAVAEMIGKKVTGPLAEEFTKADNYASRQKKNEISRDRMKGFHFLSDDDNIAYVKEAHPEDYRRWSDDPKIAEAVKNYKPFMDQLSSAWKQLGGTVKEGNYLHRVMDFVTSGIAYESRDGEIKIGKSASANGGGRDSIVSPQTAKMKSRKDSGEVYWKNGVFDFGPSFEKRWVEVMSKLDEHRLAVHSMSMGTRIMPDEAMPEKVFYNGQEFYRPDMAKEIREVQKRGVSAESKALADALGVSELPTPKDVREYATYEPLRRGSRFETAARNLAANVLAGKEDLAAQAANVNHMAKLRYALPKEIVDALNDAGREKELGALSKKISQVLGPLTQFIRQQIVGLGYGIPHMANILRKVVQSQPGAVLNPMAWANGFKVAFSKELKARGISGTEDPTYDMLLRNAAVSEGAVPEYKHYIEGNFNPTSWEGLQEAAKTAGNAFRKGGKEGAKVTPLSTAAGVGRLAIEPLNRFSEAGHANLFKPGGIDQRARLWLGDFLKDRYPGMDEQRIAHEVNQTLGRYNRASWTDVQRNLGPLMLFPGWDYSSMAFALKHPFKTAVAPAVLMLLANAAVHSIGANKNDEKNDLERVHVGKYSIRTNLFNDNMGTHMWGWALRGGKAALDHKNAKQATGEVVKGIPGDVAGVTTGTMNPILSTPIQVGANRVSPGRAEEIAKPGDFKKKGKVLPNKAAEDYLDFGARRAFPIYDRATQTGQRPSLASFAGLAGVSVTAPKKSMETRSLSKNDTQSSSTTPFQDLPAEQASQLSLWNRIKAAAYNGTGGSAIPPEVMKVSQGIFEDLLDTKSIRAYKGYSSDPDNYAFVRNGDTNKIYYTGRSPSDSLTTIHEMVHLLQNKYGINGHHGINDPFVSDGHHKYDVPDNDTLTKYRQMGVKGTDLNIERQASLVSQFLDQMHAYVGLQQEGKKGVAALYMERTKALAPYAGDIIVAARGAQGKLRH